MSLRTRAAVAALGVAAFVACVAIFAPRAWQHTPRPPCHETCRDTVGMITDGTNVYPITERHCECTDGGRL